MWTLGEGIALGFWQAQALAHRTHLIARDNRRLVCELETWTNQTLGPHYARQVQIDEAMVQSLRAGKPRSPVKMPSDETSALMALRAQGDKEAAAAFHRIDNLLTDPSEEFARSRSSTNGVRDFLRAAPRSGAAGPAASSSLRSIACRHEGPFEESRARCCLPSNGQSHHPVPTQLFIVGEDGGVEYRS